MVRVAALTAAAALAAAACRGGEAHPPAAGPPPPVAATVADAGSPAASATAPAGPCDGAPRTLAPGVTAERRPVAGTPAIAGVDPCLDLVRVDLVANRLRILAAARDGGARPAPRWVDDFDLTAVVNLGMFADDGAPVALAVDGAGALEPRDRRKFGGFLAWDPADPVDPPVALAGRGCPGFALGALRRRYRAVVQGYRLLGCAGGAIAWKDPKRYSAAAVGVDRAGRLVLVHVRAPFTMRELSAALADPALGLAGAIFVEGGPEASLVVRGPGGRLDRMGSFETGFVETDDNRRFWDLPNVLAVSRRDPPHRP
jgi:Phosphodiester glycosidase